MLTEFGDTYLFPGSMVPLHTNRMGVTKSIDWETGILLKAFAEYYRPKTIVELGTFRGYSTSWLILGQSIAYYDSREDYAVHAFEVFSEGAYGEMWYDIFELPKENFFYHEIPKGIWNFPSEIPEKIDLLFHDTQHLPDPTTQELNILLPRISRGGFVIVDDMIHPDYWPMQGIVNEVFSNKNVWEYQVLPLGHGLGIARRVRDITIPLV